MYFARNCAPTLDLAVPPDERERPHLVRERVKCGKSRCGCARDPRRRHGPYTYLRWEHWAASGNVAYYRECVPPSELVRVRRWIRRYRTEAAEARGFLTALRRLAVSEERRERRRQARVRVQIIYRPFETAISLPD